MCKTEKNNYWYYHNPEVTTINRFSLVYASMYII